MVRAILPHRRNAMKILRNWAGMLALAAPVAFAQAHAPSRIDALQVQLQASPHVRALVIAKGDRQVFAHYRADTTPSTLLNVASVSKSVTALLAGIAAERGLLRVDEPLAAASTARA